MLGGDEGKLWYFREDLLLSIFHWHWHIIYPTGYDDTEYVELPRRGELFVYLHRQFVARYDSLMSIAIES